MVCDLEREEMLLRHEEVRRVLGVGFGGGFLGGWVKNV